MSQTRLVKSITSVPGFHVGKAIADPERSGDEGSHSTRGDMGVGKMITPDVTLPVSHGAVSGIDCMVCSSCSDPVALGVEMHAESEPEYCGGCHATCCNLEHECFKKCGSGTVM